MSIIFTDLETIRRLAETYKGARLVDVEKALAEEGEA